MIEKVRDFWVEGMLRQSLYEVARIELEMDEQPGAPPRPWEMAVERPERARRTLGPEVRMGEVFDEHRGSLLILGAPGSGKTTVLLELAGELLDRAERDPTHLFPVILNLSTWANRQKPLDAWLVDALYDRYGVPRAVGQDWVEGDQILPLLDGLDEVSADAREACAGAINAYRKEHGRVPMAVCSRTKAYEALAAKLRVVGVVAIRPLTREQVDAYLARAGEALAGLRDALGVENTRTGADGTLYELLETPLMLNAAALAYQGAAADAVAIAGTTAERRAQLYARYVAARFERQGVERPYTREQSERWLAWLARQMVAHGVTVFDLEGLQPGWLPTSAQQRLYRILVGLVVGLVAGLGSALIFGLFSGPVEGLIVGLVVGLVFGSSIGSNEVRPAETARWSWRGALVDMVLGLAGGLVAGLIGWLVFGLLAGLAVGLVSGLVGGLLVGLLFRMEPAELTDRARPNEGIRRSARNGLVAGLFVGLVSGPVSGLFFGLLSTPFVGLYVGLFFGSIVGLFVGLVAGGRACLQHFILRMLLEEDDLAPWHYVPFLEHAEGRVLLRRVGGGYMFLHRTLMEWFAGR